MDRDELIKEWQTYEADYFTNPEDGRCLSDMVVDFALKMYVAGQRAERVRIADELETIAVAGSIAGTGSHIQMSIDLMQIVDELRADPAESGE